MLQKCHESGHNDKGLHFMRGIAPELKEVTRALHQMMPLLDIKEGLWKSAAS
jgi:hypothetical protein